MIYGDDIEIKFNKRKEFNSCSKSIPFVLETNILRIMEQILFNIICRRRSSTESEHQSERCIVHHGTKERNLVARNGMRERSEGNQGTVIQESILHACNHSANPSFTADAAFLFGKDFPGMSEPLFRYNLIKIQLEGLFLRKDKHV